MKRKKSSSIEFSVYKGLNFKKLSIEFDELLKKSNKRRFWKMGISENLRGNSDKSDKPKFMQTY